VWLARALVAAAPCAFAISVPVTVVAAIGAATRSGVAHQGRGTLEALGRVRSVAANKTGTLTQNRPEVVEVVYAGAGRDDAVALAAALEAHSEHPAGPGCAGCRRPPGPGPRRGGGRRIRGWWGSWPARSSAWAGPASSNAGALGSDVARRPASPRRSDRLLSEVARSGS